MAFFLRYVVQYLNQHASGRLAESSVFQKVVTKFHQNIVVKAADASQPLQKAAEAKLNETATKVTGFGGKFFSALKADLAEGANKSGISRLTTAVKADLNDLTSKVTSKVRSRNSP